MSTSCNWFLGRTWLVAGAIALCALGIVATVILALHLNHSLRCKPMQAVLPPHSVCLALQQLHDDAVEHIIEQIGVAKQARIDATPEYVHACLTALGLQDSCETVCGYTDCTRYSVYATSAPLCSLHDHSLELRYSHLLSDAEHAIHVYTALDAHTPDAHSSPGVLRAYRDAVAAYNRAGATLGAVKENLPADEDRLRTLAPPRRPSCAHALHSYRSHASDYYGATFIKHAGQWGTGAASQLLDDLRTQAIAAQQMLCADDAALLPQMSFAD
jgi:hypothetical protein